VHSDEEACNSVSRSSRAQQEDHEFMTCKEGGVG